MSSSLVTTTPHQQPTTSTGTSSPPLPASFLRPKTTAQTQLTLTNHSKPPSRDPSPHQQPLESGGPSSASGGESARRLLQNVKQEDEQDGGTGGGKKKTKLFGRRSNPPSTSDSGVNQKMYAKMGIVMPSSPAPAMRSATLGTRQSLDLTTSNRTQNLAQVHGRTSTMPNIYPTASETLQPTVVPYDSPSRQRAYHVSSPQPPPVNVESSSSRGGSPGGVVITPRSSTPVHMEGFEVINIGDVPDGRVQHHTQPSPPISLKSEPPGRAPAVNGEQTSSPDSGYGNTPGSEGTDSNSLPRRRKRSQQEGSANVIGDSESRRSPLHHVNGGMTATQGESSAVNLDPTSAVRTRGSTCDSMCSTESSEPSPLLPGNQPLLRPTGSVGASTGESRTDIIGKTIDSQPLPSTAVQTPTPLMTNVQLNMSQTTATSVLPYPPRTRPSSSEMDAHARRAHSVIPTSASLTDFQKIKQQQQALSEDVTGQQRGFLQTQPAHVSSRVQRQPSPSRRRNRHRALSQHFTRSAEVRSIHSTGRSATMMHHSHLHDEKDYFQVTDQLSKENSHFALSEALLAVVEQYKANCLEQQQQVDTPLSAPTSPTPLAKESPDGTMWAWSPQYGATPPSESMSMGPSSMASWGSMSSIATNDDPYDGFSPRRIPRISLLELMHSSAWDISAESTAQKLLQHMAAKLTGNDGEELNLSQMVLKLPTDFLTSLQLDEDLSRSVKTSSAHIRGSKEWAPPRKQIIYHIKQPSKNLLNDLAAQGYRCTGCGMQVDSAHARNFRFCNYTGKYFCQNCHTNATSIIPAHILEKWSFKRLPVSNFARDFLNKIYMEPVLTVSNSMCSKVPIMAQTRDLRQQLVSIRQYLKTCRRSQSFKLTFDGHAPWTTDVHTYCLDDFYEIKGGVKLKQLRSMLSDAIEHVKNCPICMGKGFVCEFCHNMQDVIFPFEVNRVVTCGNCKCCFHKECYSKTKPCPRCTRVKERQKRRLAKIVYEKDDEEEEDHVS